MKLSFVNKIHNITFVIIIHICLHVWVRLDWLFSIFQISNPALIDLIRRKVKLNQPYVGIFLRKKEDEKSDVVSSLEDLHDVGVFAQIHEMQDMDYKLRLVVMAHRRIKITGQFVEDEIETGPAGKYEFYICFF